MSTQPPVVLIEDDEPRLPNGQTPDEAVQESLRTGTTVADVLRQAAAEFARAAARTKEIEMPGSELIKFRIRRPPLEHRTAFREALEKEVDETQIAICTDAILVKAGDAWTEVRDGWSEVAAMLGRPGLTQSAAVLAQCGDDWLIAADLRMEVLTALGIMNDTGEIVDETVAQEEALGKSPQSTPTA